MLKNISNLGRSLNKVEQKSIHGGKVEPIPEIVCPIGHCVSNSGTACCNINAPFCDCDTIQPV